MTLQAVANRLTLAYPQWIMRTAASQASRTMDATGEAHAHVVTIPKTGNIRKIGFFTSTVTTPQTLDARLETVDLTTGFPTGTLFGATTNGSQASPASNTWYWVTLTADAAVTIGDVLAIVVTWAGTVGSLQIKTWGSVPILGEGAFPYEVNNTGSYAKVFGSIGMLALEYSDGSHVHLGTFPTNSTTFSQTVGSGSTPDEVGVRFQLPFSCKIIGAEVRVPTVSVATTFALKLYDSDGTTVLKSKTGIDSDVAAAGVGPSPIFFADEQQLTINTNYRLTVLPEAAATLTLHRADVDAAATLDCWPGGQNWHWTQRTDAGAWTDTTTRVPMFLSLLLSSLDDGAGGAGGILVNPGMRGGLL